MGRPGEPVPAPVKTLWGTPCQHRTAWLEPHRRPDHPPDVTSRMLTGPQNAWFRESGSECPPWASLLKRPWPGNLVVLKQESCLLPETRLTWWYGASGRPDTAAEAGPAMMGRKARHFMLLPTVSLEELVPADHFYRHLERVLDLFFVASRCRTATPAVGAR